MNRKVPVSVIAVLLIAALILDLRGALLAGSKAPLVVVLSFDYEDLAPVNGDGDLGRIFNLLERHDAPATFFVIGATADKDPEGVREIYLKGHSIGLHTYYHNFPIFREEDAVAVGKEYGRSTEEVWNLSFKSEGDFYEDLEANQEVIRNATGITPTLFRSPCLAANFARRERYFSTLRKAGIEIDSSVQQDFKDPKPFFVEGGLVQVPVVFSEKRLGNFSTSLKLADMCAKAGVPLVLYLHPREMSWDMTVLLDDYLDNLEEGYDVTYIKLEDVPTYFTP